MLTHPQPPALYSSSFLFIPSSLIERYDFCFQILIKREIPGQKKYFPGFQKIFLDFPGFLGHTMKFQVFPGFPGPLATFLFLLYLVTQCLYSGCSTFHGVNPN